MKINGVKFRIRDILGCFVVAGFVYVAIAFPLLFGV